MNRDTVTPDGLCEPAEATWPETAAAVRGAAHSHGTRPAGNRSLPGGRTVTVLLATAAALAGTAVAVNWQARRAERRHPPIGDFITVDGFRLHYIEAGEGPPVVLLHGNGSMLNDVALSIFEPLSANHRVIAFDRPGFGYSERPRDTVWTPEAQAQLFREACEALDVDRPVLYGHSFGAPVVVSFAIDHPESTRGIVAASGYYYPKRRLDSGLAVVNKPTGDRPGDAQHPDADRGRGSR